MKSKKVNKNDIGKSLLPYLFMILLFLTMFYVFNALNNKVNVLTYNEFMKELNKGTITEVEITTRGSAYTYEVKGKLKKYKENETFFSRLPLSEEVMKKLVSNSEKNKYKMEVKPDPESSSLLLILVNVVPIILILGIGFWFFNRQLAGGKSRAKLSSEKNKVTFKDVAG